MSTDASKRKKKKLLIAGAVALVLICTAAVCILVSRPGKETVDRAVKELPAVAGEFKSLSMDA